MFSYQNMRNNKQSAQTNYEASWLFNGNASEDIEIHFFDVNDTGIIDVAYDYKTSKYTSSDINAIHSRILHMINQIIENNDILLKELEIVNYRNYEKAKVNFCSGTNIFYGKNAQGKTNLLEAVSLFSSGKSYRRVLDRNLINLEKDFTKIKVLFESYGCEKDAEILINKNKKFIKLCGSNLRKTSEILGVFKTVLFSPEEMYLVSGAPELRRNFTDMLLSSEKPLYYSILKKYYKILKQKNNYNQKMDGKV